MPVYEYRCESCQKQFEYEHRMSEKRTECVECGGALERIVSRTSFAFKGGGWYKDLYASPKPASMSGESTGEGASSAPPASTAAAAPAAPASTDKPSVASSTDKGSAGGSSGGGTAASS